MGYYHYLAIFIFLTYRYEQQEVALNCGAMLRECIRYEALTKILLNSENFYDFFKYVEVSTFDIASDAFATFKVSCLKCSLTLKRFQILLYVL
jgi:calcium binding protein 39